MLLIDDVGLLDDVDVIAVDALDSALRMCDRCLCLCSPVSARADPCDIRRMLTTADIDRRIERLLAMCYYLRLLPSLTPCDGYLRLFRLCSDDWFASCANR